MFYAKITLCCWNHIASYVVGIIMYSCSRRSFLYFYVVRIKEQIVLRFVLREKFMVRPEICAFNSMGIIICEFNSNHLFKWKFIAMFPGGKIVASFPFF